MKFFSSYLKYWPLISLMVIRTNKTFAQIDSMTTQYIHHLSVTHSLGLSDSLLECTFILDSTRTEIKAINKKGILLWQTKPITDNNLKDAVNYPDFVIQFKFITDSAKFKEQEIYITTNSGFFGYIRKEDGKLNYVARD